MYFIQNSRQASIYPECRSQLLTHTHAHGHITPVLQNLHWLHIPQPSNLDSFSFNLKASITWLPSTYVTYSRPTPSAPLMQNSSTFPAGPSSETGMTTLTTLLPQPSGTLSHYLLNLQLLLSLHFENSAQDLPFQDRF